LSPSPVVQVATPTSLVSASLATVIPTATVAITPVPLPLPTPTVVSTPVPLPTATATPQPVKIQFREGVAPIGTSGEYFELKRFRVENIKELNASGVVSASVKWGDSNKWYGVPIDVETGDILAAHIYRLGGYFDVDLKITSESGDLFLHSFSVFVNGPVSATPTVIPTPTPGATATPDPYSYLSLGQANARIDLTLLKDGSDAHARTRICNQHTDTLTYASRSLNAVGMREVGGDNSTSVRISSGDALIPGSLNDGTSWNVATGNLGGMYNIGASSGVNYHSYLEIVVHEPLALNACSDLSWAADPQTVADPGQYGIYYHPTPNSDQIRNAIVSGRIELEVLEAGFQTDGNGMRHPRTHLSFKRSDDSEYFCQVLERDLLRCSDAREFSLDQTSTSSWSGPTYGWHSSLFATDDSGGPD
jgi:hypothetical protein